MSRAWQMVPLFEIAKPVTRPCWIHWHTKTQIFWTRCADLSRGTSGKNRIRPELFLTIKIPLPPLSEQRRIVARVEALAARIEEAKGLRREAVEEADNLLITMAHRPDLDIVTKKSQGWTEVALEEVIHQEKDNHIVKPDVSYPNLGIYSFARGLFKKPPIQGHSTSAKTLRRVSAGQFIYSRLFAFEGAYGMVSDEFDGYFVSNEYFAFECDPGRIRVEFLYVYFKSPIVWNAIATGSKGLGDRRLRVQPDRILAHRLMLPP